MAEQSQNRGLPFKPAQSLGRSTDSLRASDLSRPSTEVVHTPSPSETETQARPRSNDVDVRTMIVGPETSFSGEIASCNRLILEGTLEAKLDDCQYVIINEGGIFRGEGSADNADVRGSFEGNLVVRKRLLIRATGQVSGTIAYGEIEIECGGKISGKIESHTDGSAISHAGPARVANAISVNGRLG